MKMIRLGLAGVLLAVLGVVIFFRPSRLYLLSIWTAAVFTVFLRRLYGLLTKRPGTEARPHKEGYPARRAAASLTFLRIRSIASLRFPMLFLIDISPPIGVCFANTHFGALPASDAKRSLYLMVIPDSPHRTSGHAFLAIAAFAPIEAHAISPDHRSKAMGDPGYGSKGAEEQAPAPTS